jgi:hypothetical protein
MSLPLNEDTRLIYRARLVIGRTLATSRLARLARDVLHLEGKYGEDAPETKLAQERHDLEQAFITGLQGRIDLIDDGGP